MVRTLRAVLVGLSAVAVCAVPVASARDYFQTVSGRAYVDLRGHTGADVQYHITINAFEAGQNDFLGTVATRFSRADHGSAITLSRVVCMEVSGNSAWIGSTVTHTTNDQIFALGDQLITYVRDFGETGDVVHHEAVKQLLPSNFDSNDDGDVDCQDRPVLYPSTVESGNVIVR